MISSAKDLRPSDLKLRWMLMASSCADSAVGDLLGGNSLPSLPLRENTVFLKGSAHGYHVLYMCLFPDIECEKSSQLTFFFPILFSFIACVVDAVLCLEMGN